MTLCEFNAMDRSGQAEAVWNGVHILARHDEQHSILLYQIDSFYVEVYYHRKHNKIERFRSFSNTDQLQPYLNLIDINELINIK